MIYATESTDKIRAIIMDLRGKPRGKDWESACAKEVPGVWMTDCQSLSDYLVNPVAAGSEDKRLEIDLEDLRERLWEYPDGSLKDLITEAQTDKVRWIDTSTMICDPQTKNGPANFSARLRSTMSTGILDLHATKESQMKKMKQQKSRMSKILEKD